MTTRTLNVALWEYRDTAGRTRTAHHLEQVEVDDAEMARGEKAGVFLPASKQRTTDMARSLTEDQAARMLGSAGQPTSPEDLLNLIDRAAQLLAEYPDGAVVAISIQVVPELGEDLHTVGAEIVRL